MTTISVPLNIEAEKALKELIEITGTNRVAIIRKAIKHLREEEAEGKLLRGTARGILQK